MKSNKFIIKILTLAAAPLLLTACGEKKENNSPETQAVRITDDTGNSKVQNNTEAFSDVKVFEDVASSTKKHVSELLRHYHALKEAMVKEQPAKAKQVGQDLEKTLDAFDTSALPETQQAFYRTHAGQIKEASAGISSASDIDAQRKGLPTLTSSLYSLAKAYKANQETLYYQYCPMAFDNDGGYWISDSEEIENPYFGDQMLHCGATRATLAGNQN